MQYKNNIKNILTMKNISIKKMSEDLNVHYTTMNALVNREFLDATQFANVANIAEYLNTEIDLLYVNVDKIKENDSEEVKMNKENLIKEGRQLQKVISTSQGYKTTEEYIKNMTSTIYHLQDSYNRNDTAKFIERVLTLYSTYKLQIPFDVQELLSSKDKNWKDYAIAFVSGLMSA